MMSAFPTSLAALLAAFTLCGCSSTKKDSSSGSEKKLSSRLASKWSTKQRSSFEKQAQKSEKTKNVKTGSFHTKDYVAKSASGTVDKKYKGKEFAQADKKDTSMQKSFSGAHESNRMGSEQFKTSESHFGDKTSHDASRMNHDEQKSFSGSSRSFPTTNDAIGSKALKSAPKDKSLDSSKAGYTEDEVRAMLNKH